MTTSELAEAGVQMVALFPVFALLLTALMWTKLLRYLLSWFGLG